MIRYVRADRVWCAWQGDNVVIHARFRNSSIEHITINWHPSYSIRGGGSHGDGFSSMEDSGVNAHASRGVFVKQKPKGVPKGSPLSACHPSFSFVECGLLDPASWVWVGASPGPRLPVNANEVNRLGLRRIRVGQG